MHERTSNQVGKRERLASRNKAEKVHVRHPSHITSTGQCTVTSLRERKSDQDIHLQYPARSHCPCHLSAQHLDLLTNLTAHELKVTRLPGTQYQVKNQLWTFSCISCTHWELQRHMGSGGMPKWTSVVCIMDRDNILLLFQEEKRYLEVIDPRPQLIAEAIASA